MSHFSCGVLFALSDGHVPQKVKDKIEEMGLAQRAGDADVVDSCDLLSFYQDKHAKPKDRLLFRSDFYEQVKGGAGAEVVFSFDRFLSHLSVVGQNKVHTLRDLIGQRKIKKPKTFDELLASVPQEQRSPGGEQRLKALRDAYPFCSKSESRWDDVAVVFKGEGLDTRVGVISPVSSMMIDGYHKLYIHQDGTLTEVTVGSGYAAVTINRYAKDGSNLGVLNLSILRVLGQREVTVQGSMPQAEWNRIKAGVVESFKVVDAEMVKAIEAKVH